MRHLILILALLTASCSTSTLPSFKTYKLDVQQGNVITSKMMLQLKPGMTKSQVRYVLGTPLLQDSFHPDRWDYLYEMNRDGKVIERRRVVLEFGEDGLRTVRGDIIPAGQPGAGNAPVASIEDVTTATSNKALLNEDPQRSWIDRFKFWADDEPVDPKNTHGPKVYQGRMDVVVDASAKPEPEPEIKTPAKAEMLADTVESEVSAPDADSVAEANIEAAPAAELAAQSQEMEVASKTAVAATLSEEQVAISKRLNAWAEAWRTKNIAQYLGYYSNQFRPEGITNKAWVAQRQQRLAKPGPINLTIDNVSVRVDGPVASARFIQTYSANGYSDRVSKLMVFEQQNAEWRIVKESVVAKVDGILPSALESNQISEPLEAGKPRDVTLDEKSEGPPVRKQAPAVQAAPPEPEEVAEEQPASETQMPDEAVDAKPVSKPVEKTKDQAVEKPAEKPVVKPVTKVPSKAVEKNDSNKSKPLSEEDEPGYFDRILEKIGF